MTWTASDWLAALLWSATCTNDIDEIVVEYPSSRYHYHVLRGVAAQDWLWNVANCLYYAVPGWARK